MIGNGYPIRGMRMDHQRDRPRYSIVIPAFNEAEYLPATVASLQGQDYTGAFEIVVVDNNSSDGTAEVARALGAAVFHESRQGVCAARQRGAEAALGEILISADADTIYPPHWLSTVDRTFSEHPDAVAVASPCRYTNPAWWAALLPAALFGLVGLIAHLFGPVFYISAANFAVRRSAFPGYNPELTQGGDELDLVRRVRKHGRVIWNARNTVLTSPRRFGRGMLYTLFYYVAVCYLLTYVVNRISGRRTMGMAPAFRTRRARRDRQDQRDDEHEVIGLVDVELPVCGQFVEAVLTVVGMPMQHGAEDGDRTAQAAADRADTQEGAGGWRCRSRRFHRTHPRLLVAGTSTAGPRGSERLRAFQIPAPRSHARPDWDHSALLAGHRRRQRR